MSLLSFLKSLFTGSSSATSGGGFGARRGNETPQDRLDNLLDSSYNLFGLERNESNDLLPPIQDDAVSAPSSAEQYSDHSSYDDYLAMLQKGADIGLFSTAQDVVNEAQKDRLFQSLEADKERAWYEDLANTSYQRQVKDLQAAGLNPILGFTNLGQGSSTAHTAVPAGRATGLSAVAPNLADYLYAGSNLVSSASKVVSSVSSLLKVTKKK